MRNYKYELVDKALARGDDWQPYAACRTTPEPFDPSTEDRASVAAKHRLETLAIAVCRTCVVAAPCLEEELASNFTSQVVRGGLLPVDLNDLKDIRRSVEASVARQQM